MSASLQFTILGCGSSTGVPRLGGADGSGEWGACDPANPKNRRRRCSLLVRRGGTNVLVDTSTDLREQLLAARAGHIDATLITHSHADQTHGIDDLRALTFISGRKIDFYADALTLDQLTNRFFYCFSTVEGTGYAPILAGRRPQRRNRRRVSSGRASSGARAARGSARAPFGSRR